MGHQMAAGAPLSHPRFDAHLQRDIHQHPYASMAGMSANDMSSPHLNEYSQGNQQNESQYRYSLSTPMGPSTLPPFVSQKVADPLYNYAGEHSNADSAQQPRQTYPMGREQPQSDTEPYRSSSSCSSVEGGNGRWPAIYTMHPDDHRLAQHARSQLHISTQPHYPSLGSDVRANAFHVTATM